MKPSLKLYIIISLAILIIFIGYFALTHAYMPEKVPTCESEAQVAPLNIEGMIVGLSISYKNQNHQIIYIESDNGDKNAYTFTNGDNSGLFDSLKPGDRILKKAGELDVLIISKDNSKSIILSYDCDDGE